MHPFGLFLLSLFLICGYFWVRSQPAKQQRSASLKLAMLVVVLALIYLAVTGRLHWLGALIVAVLPFLKKLFPLLLRLIPFGSLLKRSGNPGHSSSGNTSEVSTAMLTMILDHDSGQMQGSVTAGQLQGRPLSGLSEQEFMQLLSECRRQDNESARLLEAYLDKRFGDSWRQDDPGNGQQQAHEPGGPMSNEEACQILGLNSDPSEQEVIDAHRRLMQKVHPDRGGSDYLAAKINQAKDQLLKA
ncbi:J domain-containing protein [Marinobacterium jannaschii]|uniref:molecular chaperone DnaJ n=1 Tax=Marinobacterium jannaschii TaxID=64970 RepID=UPI000480B35B|nr:molecular chaperone DnaJ [Marinobacterium jannaschii]